MGSKQSKQLTTEVDVMILEAMDQDSEHVKEMGYQLVASKSYFQELVKRKGWNDFTGKQLRRHWKTSLQERIFDLEIPREMAFRLAEQLEPVTTEAKQKEIEESWGVLFGTQKSQDTGCRHVVRVRYKNETEDERRERLQKRGKLPSDPRTTSTAFPEPYSWEPKGYRPLPPREDEGGFHPCYVQHRLEEAEERERKILEIEEKQLYAEYSGKLKE